MSGAFPPELLEIVERTGLEPAAMTPEESARVRRLLGIKPWEASPEQTWGRENEAPGAAAWGSSLPRAVALRKALRAAVELD